MQHDSPIGYETYKYQKTCMYAVKDKSQPYNYEFLLMQVIKIQSIIDNLS